MDRRWSSRPQAKEPPSPLLRLQTKKFGLNEFEQMVSTKIQQPMHTLLEPEAPVPKKEKRNTVKLPGKDPHAPPSKLFESTKPITDSQENSENSEDDLPRIEECKSSFAFADQLFTKAFNKSERDLQFIRRKFA